jgi:hypothetical protein
MGRARCFLGAVTDLDGRIHALGAAILRERGEWNRNVGLKKRNCGWSVRGLWGWFDSSAGGGDDVWRGAEVFSSTEVYAKGVGEAVATWRTGITMNHARCGLSACLTEEGTIVVAGGEY